MSKRDRLLKQTAALIKQGGGIPSSHFRDAKVFAHTQEMVKQPEIKPQDITVCNGHVFRAATSIFDEYHVREYPPEESIPAEFSQSSNKYRECARDLFHHGGTLEEYCLKFKPEFRDKNVFGIIRAMLQSLNYADGPIKAPPHHHKMAAVAWFLSEVTMDYMAAVA